MSTNTVQKNLVLLPGIDGTGLMFEPFLKVLRAPYRALVVSYPKDKPLHYYDLLPCIREVVPWKEPFSIIAESFAGPLALEFASRQWEDVESVILCASFIASPFEPFVQFGQSILETAFFRKVPPLWLLQKYMTGENPPEPLVSKLKECLAEVSPEVLSYRTRMIANTNASQQLMRCKPPLVYIEATKDELVGSRGWEQIAEIRPDTAHFKVDAPHLLLQTRPQEALAVMERYWKAREQKKPLDGVAA